MKYIVDYYRVLLALGCLFITYTLTSQTDSTDALIIDAKAIYTEDGDIVIRWVPSNYKTWLWGRDSGFILQRITLEIGDSVLSFTEMDSSIVTIELLPKNQTEWETAINIDSAVGIVAASYFGDNFTVLIPSDQEIVTSYNISSEKDNRFGLALFAADISTLAAEMQNLYYKDETVMPLCKYSYLIRPRGNLNSNYARLGVTSVKTNMPYHLPVPTDFLLTPGDSSALLTWDQAATSEYYSSYNIYRSDDDGNSFVKINKQPITPMGSYSDEPSKQIIYYCGLPDNIKQYQFKVCGHSPFGFDGPLTMPLTIQGVPKPLNAEISLTNVMEFEGGVEINWSFLTPLNDQIHGFNLLRAPKYEGDYVIVNLGIIPASNRKYTDTSPLPKSYYKVEFIDLNNNKVSSISRLIQLKDSVPPIPSMYIRGEAVGNGEVLKIQWSPSVSEDVMGYRVYIADHPNGEFGQITTKWVADTIFFHKVNLSSLTEEKYFKVKALDFRENTSDFSPLCTVILPDIVPPSQPVMKNAEPQQNGIMVSFAPSQSSDVQIHQILRRKKNHANWEIVAILDSLDQKTSFSYLDTTTQKMYTYDYMVQTIDDADQKSNSKIFSAKSIGDGMREKIQGLDVRFVKSGEYIKLNWAYNNAYGISRFVIYRGTDANTLYEVASVIPQQVLKGGEYNGPNPFNTGNPVGTQGGGQPQGFSQLTPGNFNLQQIGSPNTNNNTFYEYFDKEFSKFRHYYFAIGVRFEDGTGSQLSDVKSTSTY